MLTFHIKSKYKLAGSSASNNSCCSAVLHEWSLFWHKYQQQCSCYSVYCEYKCEFNMVREDTDVMSRLLFTHNTRTENYITEMRGVNRPPPPKCDDTWFRGKRSNSTFEHKLNLVVSNSYCLKFSLGYCH